MAIDARIKITRELLNNAFIDILEEKPLSKITVKEICERADINRSTYYAHYDNPYAQFENLKSIFLETVEGILGKYKKSGKKISDSERITEIFKVYYENRKLFLVIANSSTFNELVELVKGYTKTTSVKQWSEEYNTSDLKNEYAFEYVSTGTLRIIYNWLSDKNGIKDINEVAPIAVELFDNTKNFLKQ